MKLLQQNNSWDIFLLRKMKLATPNEKCKVNQFIKIKTYLKEHDLWRNNRDRSFMIWITLRGSKQKNEFM